MNLSREQQLSFDKYIQGKNIFITGPGGTGKTALIKKMKQHSIDNFKNMQVCALTGCAAVLLGCSAKTIHSWAGIGLASGPIDGIVSRVMRNRYAKTVWKSVNILVVDEVSMLSKKLFETLDLVGQSTRGNKKVFGGIQIIFSGDFYQLPPVGNKDEPETSQFCFESGLWMRAFAPEDHIELTKIFRQSDPVYQKILNELREGRLKKSSNIILLNNVNRLIPKDAMIRPTKLYPTRNKVDNINRDEMSKLPGEIYEFELKYRTDLEMTNVQRMQRLSFTKENITTELMYLKGNVRCDSTICLKKGAQVMCVVNIPLSNGGIICNGARGILMDVTENNLPVVLFNNGYQMTMAYHVWESENIPGIGISQIPLISAWALTIHKAQGATLDVAEVDAGSGIFECGQTYVALSRIKSLDGLYLSSFDVNRVKINSCVQKFYKSIDHVFKARTSEFENETREIESLPEAVAVPIEAELCPDDYSMLETDTL